MTLAWLRGTVRYLTGDPPALAGIASRIIDGEPDLEVTDVVIRETAYVLMKVYEVPRHVVVDGLIDLLRKPNMAPYALDKAVVIQALRFCRDSGRVSVADALVWAAARSSGTRIAYSFDERFPSLGLEVRSEA